MKEPEVEYYYVRGKGWLCGYKGLRPMTILELQETLKRVVRFQPLEATPGMYIRQVFVRGTVEI